MVDSSCGHWMPELLTGFTPMNLITGDGGRTGVQPDLSKLSFVRVIYGSEGGMGEAYYAYDGRVWARWETDFPQGDDNLSHRLTQLTRIKVSPIGASRFLTAPDLGDFPMLFMSDPGYMVLSRQEIAALRRYLASGGFLWVDDFWGDAEWKQFADVMREVLPGQSVAHAALQSIRSFIRCSISARCRRSPHCLSQRRAGIPPSGAHTNNPRAHSENRRCEPGWMTTDA